MTGTKFGFIHTYIHTYIYTYIHTYIVTGCKCVRSDGELPSRKAELPLNGTHAYRRSHSPVRTHAAAARRSRPSAAVGFSRRQPASTYILHTTRDFAVAVSPSVTTQTLGSVVCRRTHTHGGADIRLAEAPVKG